MLGLAVYLHGSQPTYEGLKRDLAKQSNDLRPVFPAYLRGIETCLQFPSAPSAMGSQPTYEGLKPGEKEGVFTELVGSQPTYEGLKLA